MKTLTFFTTAILLFSSLIINAQTNDIDDNPNKGRQIYSEFGGPGVIFSANFDSRFKKETDLGLGYRIGLGFGISDQHYYYNNSYTDEYGSHYYVSSYSETRSYVTIPLGINYILGKKSSPHSFEMGAGITFLTRKVDLYNYDDEYKPGYVIGHTTFMYRRKPLDGGFTWRIGFTPIIGTAGSVFPSMAVGVGYAF